MEGGRRGGGEGRGRRERVIIGGIASAPLRRKGGARWFGWRVTIGVVRASGSPKCWPRYQQRLGEIFKPSPLTSVTFPFGRGCPKVTPTGAQAHTQVNHTQVRLRLQRLPIVLAKGDALFYPLHVTYSLSNTLPGASVATVQGRPRPLTRRRGGMRLRAI